MTNDDFLSVSDLSKKLKISRNTCYHLLLERKILGFKVGRSWRIPQSNLNSYITVQSENYKGEDKNDNLQSAQRRKQNRKQ